MKCESVINRLKDKISIVQSDYSYSMNIDEIVSTIKVLHSQRLLVPVICEDMYEFVDPETHECRSLHSYIVEKVINRNYRKGKRLEMTLEELDDIVENGYFGLSLLQTKIGTNTFRDIYSSVVDEDDNIRKGICLKREVKDFLIAGNFPLIITTNCFPIIENELRNYCSYWNEIEKKNDDNIPDNCVYHIFGRAKLQDSNWGYNEKQILRFLQSAHSSDYAMKNLMTVIENNNSRQTLMILGNDSPDWLFRFILSPIYGRDLYDDGIGYYINEEHRADDRNLTYFLKEIKFTKESQLIEVLNKLTQKIIRVKSSVKCGHEKMYDFFVSHASEDEGSVRELVIKLRENGLNVWVDYEAIKDGLYWQRIIDALKDSAYFIPFVTENYIKKTCNKKTLIELLAQMGIKDISLNSDEARDVNKYLEGVQVELLLASKWLEQNPRDGYSIPVILKGEEFFEEALTMSKIERWGDDSRRLPKNLFYGIQMYEFDKSSPDSFTLDWERYKSINRK